MYGYRNRGNQINNKYNWNPIVSCPNGEGIISKVALITADEFILAGLGEGYARAYITYIDDVASSYVNNSHGVLPVITLKANVTVSSGSGAEENPYVIG